MKNEKLYNAVLKEILAVARTHGVDEDLTPFPLWMRRDPLFHVRGAQGRSLDPSSVAGSFFFHRQEKPEFLSGRLSWLHAYVWRAVRRAHYQRLMDEPGELALAQTRWDLEAWAVGHFVTGVLDTRAAILGLNDAKFGLWTCGDIVGPSPLWSAGEPPPSLREEVLAFLTKAQEDAALAIADEARRAEHAPEPEPALRETLQALAKTRSALRAFVSPRPWDEHRRVQLAVEGDGVFRYHEPPHRRCGDMRSKCDIVVRRMNAGDWEVECGCVYGQDLPCRSKLAALDAVRDAACGDLPGLERVTPALRDELRRPPWQNAVDELIGLLSTSAVPDAIDGRPSRFGWEVVFAKPYWDSRLYPVMIRARKRGSGEVLDRLTIERWSAAAEELTGVNAVILHALAAQGGYRGVRDWESLSALLVQLAGSGDVYIKEGHSTRRISVRAVRATARIDMAGARLCVVPDFGSHPPPPMLLEDIHNYPDEWAAELDESNDELLLYSIPENVRRAMEFAEADATLEGPAAEAVVRGAAPLLDSGRVTLSSNIRGQRREPLDRLALDLELQNAQLYVRLRAMPTSSGATYPAGDGPETVFGSEDGARYFVKRDLAAETERAEAARRRLHLEHDDGFQWFLGVPDDALDLVARLDELGSSHGLLVRWRSRPLRASATIAAANLSVKVGSMRTWLTIGGDATIEAGDIPIEQLITAARDGRRWVELKDGFAKIEEQLRGALVAIPDGEISPYAAPLLVELEEAGATIAGDGGWRELHAKMREAATLEPAAPAALEAELRPYQLDGFRWMARLSHWATGAVLADDMGLGKTLQALTMMLHRREEGPSLVVAPTSLAFNWRREAQRFTPSQDVRLLQSGAELAVLDDIGPDVVIVTSYGLAARYADELAEVGWGTLVFDEAQALKNPATQRARAARAIEAKFTIALTGTPVENRSDELWSIMRLVVPGLLSGRQTFHHRYAVPIEKYGNEEAAHALASLISPFVLRRLKRDVAKELPDRLELRLDVELGSVERSIYDAFRAEFLAALDASEEEVKRFEVLAAITRLRQLACHPGLVDPAFAGRSAKLTALSERLDELRAEGQRALVFSQFTSLLDLVEPVLAASELRYLRIDGSTPARQRETLVDQFQSGEADVFLLSTRAGGQGLNLTAATAVFHLDPWWNPAVEDQATDRAHRIGQVEPVTVYRMLALGTIEEAIYEMHADKRALVDSLLAGSGSSAALTPEQLRELVATGGYLPEDPRRSSMTGTTASQ